MLTRGTEAANEASEVPSTLSHDYSLRFEFHYETRADTELRTLGATNEVVLFRRRHEDGVRRDRVLPSIVLLIVTVAV